MSDVVCDKISCWSFACSPGVLNAVAGCFGRVVLFQEKGSISHENFFTALAGSLPEFILVSSKSDYDGVWLAKFKALKRWSVGVPIAVVVQDPRPSFLEALLGLGVDALICEDDDSHEMTLAISNALLGRRFVAPALKKMLFDSLCYAMWKNSKG